MNMILFISQQLHPRGPGRTTCNKRWFRWCCTVWRPMVLLLRMAALPYLCAGMALGTSSARVHVSPLKLDDGQALVPPSGWTSWNSLGCQPSQHAMEAAMDALAAAPPTGAAPPWNASAGALPRSLRDHGYVRAGLDDCWQACGTGVAGSFHDARGNPLVNLSKFENMSVMVEHARSRGLQAGWYWNNCQCSEHEFNTTVQISAVYERTAAAMERYGYEGAKLDSCSQFNDLDRWASLIKQTTARTGRKVMIENCHAGNLLPHFVNGSDGKRTSELWCPFHIYRTGSDITPGSWFSMMTNLNQLGTVLDHDPPISRPGCWAYPDAVQTGSFETFEEDRSNFGAWSIGSAPLILGVNITNAERVRKAWPILTNSEAIDVNRRFAGHPGKRLRRRFENVTYYTLMAVPCVDGRKEQQGWRTKPVSSSVIGAGAELVTIRSANGMCIDASTSVPLGLQPCAEASGPHAGCQSFLHHTATGQISAPHCLSNAGKLSGCFDVSGKKGPHIQLTKCSRNPNDEFSFSAAGVFSVNNINSILYPKRCVEVASSSSNVNIEAQVWAKPQPGGGVAVFFLNALLHKTDFNISLSEISSGLGVRYWAPNSSASYTLRDMWEHKDVGRVDANGAVAASAVASHDSRLLLLMPVLRTDDLPIATAPSGKKHDDARAAATTRGPPVKLTSTHGMEIAFAKGVTFGH